MSLLPTILLVCGKVNFTNLSRYSDYSERTFRRQYRQTVEFPAINAAFIHASTSEEGVLLGSMDASFVPKSGTQTAGLDWYYNGSAGRSEKGLEISVIAVTEVDTQRSYTLSVQQTPARAKPPQAPGQKAACCAPLRKRQFVLQSQIPGIQAVLRQLPPRALVPRTRTIAIKDIPGIQIALRQLAPKPDATSEETLETTRVEHYLHHLRQTQPYFAASLKYLVTDGFYSKRKFVDGVCALNLQQIGKLRNDANLRYLYEGVQKPRGCPRKYEGKVSFTDLTHLPPASLLESRTTFYTAVVWHVSLQRKIRIVILLNPRKSGKMGMAILFSTDIELAPELIVEYYRMRFQIEFIFRDAKQFTGLCDCQSRHAPTLDFHFNASLTALNLAKYQTHLQAQSLDSNSVPEPFSMASYKRIAFNDHLLERFISQLGLDPTSIKSHSNYPNLLSYGILAS